MRKGLGIAFFGSLKLSNTVQNSCWDVAFGDEFDDCLVKLE